MRGSANRRGGGRRERRAAQGLLGAVVGGGRNGRLLGAASACGDGASGPGHIPLALPPGLSAAPLPPSPFPKPGGCLKPALAGPGCPQLTGRSGAWAWASAASHTGPQTRPGWGAWASRPPSYSPAVLPVLWLAAILHGSPRRRGSSQACASTGSSRPELPTGCGL